jgi:hypothetical protein
VASDDRLERVSVPKAVLVALAVMLAGAVVVSVSTSTASYGPYNHDWDGTTAVRSMAADADADVELVHETSAYSSVPPGDAVAFVLSPDSPYRPSEATRVTDFVRSGGTLVVADDYGPHANELLRQLGTSARLDGRPVRDIRSNYRSPAMPVATPVADHPFVAGVESVTFNHGTVVEPGEATPLVNTSEHAYVDADWNGGLGPNETLENHTVATVERVGEGQVVVVGDASAFINAMVERPGNRNFVRVLLSGHGTVVLDHSHTDGLPPAVLAVLVVRESAALQFGLGTLAVGALAVWSRRPDLVRGRVSGRTSAFFGSVSRRWLWGVSPSDGVSLSDGIGVVESSDDGLDASSDLRPSASELAAHLEREHPDWDHERVERVVSAMDRYRDQ